MSDIKLFPGQDVFILCGFSYIQTKLNDDLKPICKVSFENYKIVPVPKTIPQIMQFAEYIKNHQAEQITSQHPEKTENQISEKPKSVKATKKK